MVELGVGPPEGSVFREEEPVGCIDGPYGTVEIWPAAFGSKDDVFARFPLGPWTATAVFGNPGQPPREDIATWANGLRKQIRDGWITLQASNGLAFGWDYGDKAPTHETNLHARGPLLPRHRGIGSVLLVACRAARSASPRRRRDDGRREAEHPVDPRVALRESAPAAYEVTAVLKRLERLDRSEVGAMVSAIAGTCCQIEPSSPPCRRSDSAVTSQGPRTLLWSASFPLVGPRPKAISTR